jgi:hypothetical protein
MPGDEYDITLLTCLAYADVPQVPFNKGSLMKDRSLSPRDKRVLVRYLQACKTDIDRPNLASITYAAHLQQTHGLSPVLTRVVMQDLLWVDDDVNVGTPTPYPLACLCCHPNMHAF